MQVISSERLPIKMWLTDIEDSALEQAKNLANLPFAFKHVALMPDAHSGYGMPIGGVLATKGVVIPNAVGVDIGCGMIATRTSLREISIENLKLVMGKIREKIPVGFDHRKESNEFLMPLREHKLAVVDKEFNSACKQLGTLGGGNHFIEIQKGSDGYIWIMIHSGSRNLGKKVCDHYNALAKELNKKWFSSVPPDHDLSFLPMDTPEFKDYFNEMNYCLEFAKDNRNLMMSDVQEILYNELCAVAEETINIHHNYAAWENHFGANVIVHRKGATSSKSGQYGIIPGSQGSKSYIVKGLGNKESFESCSHGAGRKMGRKFAIKNLNFEEEVKKMEGILHSVRTAQDLDESVGAYKDIKEVISNELDLVEVVVELSPLGVVKG